MFCFLVTFNKLKFMKSLTYAYFFDFDYFLSIFLIFLPLLATKKLMTSASI